MDPKKIADNLSKQPRARRAAVKQSHFLFMLIYFKRYMKYEMAKFQLEMIALTEDESIQTLVLVGFRGCAKSTLVTMSYAIWSIIGVQQKKFVLIICKTIEQAKQQMKNIKAELERNKKLKNDLGPFEEREDWTSSSIHIKKYNARIVATSIEQSIRGIRHESTRPDLIIVDDIEDIESTRTQERRNKTYNTLVKEVIPAGDVDTRLVMLGNIVHDDSVINRFKQNINSGNLKGVYKEYPLIDKDGKCLWPEKFSNEAALEAERRRIGDEKVWLTEYLLQNVSDSDAICKREWILNYNQLPDVNI